jgi:hypothetical protein
MMKMMMKTSICNCNGEREAEIRSNETQACVPKAKPYVLIQVRKKWKHSTGTGLFQIDAYKATIFLL